MKYLATDVAGVQLVELELREDARGGFARIFDAEEFAEHGLDPAVVQCNLSFNHRAGTVRGLHLQLPPHAEGKLVRCTAGAIQDVAVDVRLGSTTRGRHVAVELSAANRLALWLPPYVAHGYQTLFDDTEVTYQVSGRYAPGAEQGYRYDDPVFGVVWPHEVTSVSDKDLAWPLVDPQDWA